MERAGDEEHAPKLGTDGTRNINGARTMPRKKKGADGKSAGAESHIDMQLAPEFFERIDNLQSEIDDINKAAKEECQPLRPLDEASARSRVRALLYPTRVPDWLAVEAPAEDEF
jgi:hypothetical protein